MKKSLFILLFATIVAKGFGQLFPPLSYPGSVGLFGLYEVSFTLPTTYSNPYDPDTINVYAEFTGPDNSSYIVNAFYYEDYTFYQHVEGYEVAVRHSENDGWRLRFTPTVVGTWSFYIRAFDKNGELNLPELNANHTFFCTSVSDVDGFISLANSRFLKRDIVKNGNRRFHSFFPIGPDEAWYSCMANVYGEFWNHPKGIYDYKRRIDSLSGNANYMRVFLNRYKSLALYGPEYATENGDMTNTAEDTIMGWCQDTAFAYQSLRWLTDSVRMQYDTLNNGQILKPFYFVDNVPPLDPNGYIYTLDPLKRPAPSSNSNVITLPIINQPVGTTYKLRWYDSETGLSNNEIILGPTVQQDFQGNKFLSFHFPSHIRDLNKQTINNTFGDAVFVLIRIDPGGPLPKE